ncbi:hypothetical protein [Nonomuraea sp. NPDC050691]|uniref:hypothetical protein n=1 Tax=Nonomuraea sp. NPDC050691 TaxID=3155661 RepID=UPI00340F8A10
MISSPASAAMTVVDRAVEAGRQVRPEHVALPDDGQGSHSQHVHHARHGPAEDLAGLVEQVAHSRRVVRGQVLFTISPRGDGSLPEAGVGRLRELGRWLAAHPDAVYGTRPWRRHAEPAGAPLRYTVRPDGTLNVIALDPAQGGFRPPTDLLGRSGAYWG